MLCVASVRSAHGGRANGLDRRSFAQDAIPVGSILDATGPINIYGLPMIDSTRFAIDDINANGVSWGGRSG